MQRSIIVLALFFSTLSTLSAWALEKDKNAILVGCQVFNLKGELIRKESGSMCIFEPNGTYYMVEKNQVVKRDSRHNIIWKTPGFYHHQMKLSADKTKLVIIGGEAQDFHGCLTRFDLVDILDPKTGKKLNQFKLFLHKEKYLARFKNRKSLETSDFQRYQFSYECDTTHVNSVYEIPPNNLEKKNPSLRAGNWLLNLSFENVALVFDRDFKKVVAEYKFNFPRNQIHDLQLLKEGKFLIYFNNYYFDAIEKKYATEVIKVNPNNLSEVEALKVKNNGRAFYQKKTGGVELLENGEMLVSMAGKLIGQKLVWLTKDGKVKLEIVPNKDFKTNLGDTFQEGKFIKYNP